MSNIIKNLTMYACIQVFKKDEEDDDRWVFVSPDEISKFAVDSYGFEIEGDYLPMCPYDDDVTYGKTAILYKCSQLLLDEVIAYTSSRTFGGFVTASLMSYIDVISEFYTTFDHDGEIVSCTEFRCGNSTDDNYKIKLIYLMFENPETHSQYFVDSFVLNTFNQE